MAFGRIAISSVMLLLVCCGPIYGSESVDHLEKKHSISVKTGAHYMEDSDFTDAWDMDSEELIGIVGELSYELKLTKNIGLEFSCGYSGSTGDSHDVFIAGDAAKLDMYHLYISPTAKLYIPISNISNTFFLYGGIGPDFYYTRCDLDYEATGYSPYGLDYSEALYGVHGLIGIEYYVFEKPAEHHFYDWPVSLEIQYRYSWVKPDSVDDKLIDVTNIDLGLSLSHNDIKVGGHIITVGLKWHF